MKFTQKLSDAGPDQDRLMLVLLTNSDHSRALQHDGHVVYQNSYGEDTIYLRVTPEYAKWLRRELEKMESERPDLFGAIDD